MAIHSASLSDRGRRKNNEDFAAHFEPVDPLELEKSGCLYIIADGVGGAAKGERASQFAAQKVLYDYYQPENIDLEPLERLRLILERVNDDIYSFASQDHTRMATTIVAAVVRGGFLYVANAGDSRAYLIRDGAAKPINRDHSIVGEMVEHGEMTEAEAMASAIKNRLTRSLGGDPEVTVGVYNPIPLKLGDKILLCSDGLTRYALQEDVTRMTAEGKPEEIAQSLVQFANRKGGADNISVIIVSYQDISMLEPAIHVKRPSPISIDTLATEPNEGIVSKSKARRIRRPLISRFAPWATAGFALIALLFFWGVYIWNTNPSLPPQLTSVVERQTEVAQMAGIAMANTQAASTAQQVMISQTDTAVAIANQTSTTAPDTRAISTPIPTNTSTPTPTNTSPSNPEAGYSCLGQVNNRPYLSDIFAQFGKKYQDYDSYNFCKGYDGQSSKCEEISQIADISHVPNGTWIIVPDVMPEEECTGKGGKWVLDESSQ